MDIEANLKTRVGKPVSHTAITGDVSYRDLGGVETARPLLPQMSDGFTQLWQRNRLDLTLKSLILQPRRYDLFSDEERDTARRRLRGCGANV